MKLLLVLIGGKWETCNNSEIVSAYLGKVGPRSTFSSKLMPPLSLFLALEASVAPVYLFLFMYV